MTAIYTGIGGQREHPHRPHQEHRQHQHWSFPLFSRRDWAGVRAGSCQRVFDTCCTDEKVPMRIRISLAENPPESNRAQNMRRRNFAGAMLAPTRQTPPDSLDLKRPRDQPGGPERSSSWIEAFSWKIDGVETVYPRHSNHGVLFDLSQPSQLPHLRFQSRAEPNARSEDSTGMCLRRPCHHSTLGADNADNCLFTLRTLHFNSERRSTCNSFSLAPTISKTIRSD